jgi:hypothetical protein
MAPVSEDKTESVRGLVDVIHLCDQRCRDDDETVDSVASVCDF